MHWGLAGRVHLFIALHGLNCWTQLANLDRASILTRASCIKVRAATIAE